MLRKTKTTVSVILLAMALAFGIIRGAPALAMEPFVGEIMIFAGNFAPRGWALCDGQLLAVSQNEALFSLLGTTYGGDGRTTFGLPDLRSRIPMNAGQGPGLTNRPLGQKSGAERVTLTINQLPAHSHALRADEATGKKSSPTGNVLAYDRRDTQYSDQGPDVDMSAAAIQAAGGGQAHDNTPPFLSVNYCIALVGYYPSRN
jgi:microcystin-dependent protein